MAVDNVEQLFRRSAGRITATLVRTLGPAHLDLAEDAGQEALPLLASSDAVVDLPHSGRSG